MEKSLSGTQQGVLTPSLSFRALMMDCTVAWFVGRMFSPRGKGQEPLQWKALYPRGEMIQPDQPISSKSTDRGCLWQGLIRSRERVLRDLPSLGTGILAGRLGA